MNATHYICVLIMFMFWARALCNIGLHWLVAVCIIEMVAVGVELARMGTALVCTGSSSGFTLVCIG